MKTTQKQINPPVFRDDASKQSLLSYCCAVFFLLIFTVTGSLSFLSIFLVLFVMSVYPHQVLWQDFVDLRIWGCMREYFSFTMYKDFDQLDPNKKYIFAEFPHGIMPFGFILSATIVQSHLSSTFRIEGSIASVLFRIPFIRQLCMWFGARPATRSDMTAVLEKGHSLGLMVGGIAEIFVSSRACEKIFLKRRKGYARIALEQGASLVPIYYFGNTYLLDFVGGSGGHSFIARISRKMRTSLLLYYGRYYLPLPYQYPITMVVGEPIDVPYTPNPSMQQVDELHEKFMQELVNLFNRYKEVVGWADKELIIV